MEAKDTLLEIPQGTEPQTELCRRCAYRHAQAEFSFKTGRKVVVDWIQQNHQYVGLCHPDAFADWIQIEMDKWQAYLKELGINP